MDYTTLLKLLTRYTTTQNATTGSYPIADKTTDINSALNWYMILANEAVGNWRPADDTNQSDYPIIKTDLVSGQQDYTFATDQDGNQILDIYKVRLLNPDGVTWTTLDQINQDSPNDAFLNPTTQGTPNQYYLTTNGIFLVNPPNYNMTAGIEVYIARTPTYFTVADTSKKAGIPWVHHEYLALRPAYLYCVQKTLPQAENYKLLLYGQDGKSGMEGAIRKYYLNRNHDFPATITSETVDSR